MDMSKEYIEMCEGAKEIQKQRKRKWQWSDIYCVLPIERVHMGKTPSICQAPSLMLGEVDFKRYKQEIWLPRQDQLQEMINDKYKFIELAREFALFVIWLFGKINNPSYEMCWLAFIMCEKFNKKWDGKEWIKKD